MATNGEAKIGILGAGAWGTAIAKVLAEKGLAVRLWSREPDLSEEINVRHTNERFLPGVALPRLVSATADIAEAAEDRDYLFLALPSLYLLDGVRAILSCADIREGRTLIAVLTKGFIDTRHGIKLIVDAVEDYLPGLYKGKLVYLSGPSQAEEVARGKITGLISASRSGRNSIRFRELLAGERLVVFASLDIRGVQISAALKNVVAIAFGMLDALKESSDRFGDNTESLLLAAGLNEIQTVGRFLGATHPETFTSIAGVGDLDVTCRSPYGRNRRFGREIVLKPAPGLRFHRRGDRQHASVRIPRRRGGGRETPARDYRSEKAPAADLRGSLPHPEQGGGAPHGAREHARADLGRNQDGHSPAPRAAAAAALKVPLSSRPCGIPVSASPPARPG
jgi:glycerol-3-phosphate dehydrogenase (NAD(P)+)